jgi:hypothetical protein
MPATPGDINNSDNGYESGGDVSKALALAGPANYKFEGTNQFVLTVGYLGISDASANNLTTNWLTFNGVAESDGAIESGTYSFYGHEHLLGKNTPSNAAATAVVPLMFAGMKYLLDNNDAAKGSGLNDKADPQTLHSSGILGYYMFADKTSQADAGYPTPAAAVGKYTLTGGSQ